MLNFLRKIKKWFFVLLVSLLTVSGFLLLNKFFKEENLFIYETGMDKKAILNSTWNMSFKEVERANKIKLKKGISFASFDAGLNKLLDLNRITAKKTEDFNLWAFNSELNYDFFDNRLFRYSLIGEVYNSAEFDSIAVTNLKKKYGEMLKGGMQYGGSFLKDSVSVEYSQFDIENEKEHRFLIKVTFLPIFNEITKKSENEQNSILN